MYDYIKRIVYGKLVDKTIDVDYEELSEYIFGDGNCYNSSEVRKRMYGIKRLIDLLEEEGIEAIDDSKILTEIDLKRIEFEKEKMRFQDQRREFNKILRQESRHEHLKSEFIKAIKDTDSIIPLDFKHREYAPSEKDGVLLIGDWHVGLTVENYWNKYNLDEFYKRVDKLVFKVEEYGKLHNIKTLHVFGLGDFLHGLIHVTTRIVSEENTVKQTKIVADVIGKLLLKFASTFQNVEFYMVTGNHARVSPNKKESLAEENFEEFISWYLEAKLENIDNINLNKNVYDNEIIVANILGHTCLGVHGDKDKITNVAQNLSLMLKIIPDYIFTADKHHLEENEIHGVEVIINRSLSGVDQYAQSIRKTSHAGQTFMIFSREEGRECTYNIKLN